MPGTDRPIYGGHWMADQRPAQIGQSMVGIEWPIIARHR